MPKVARWGGHGRLSSQLDPPAPVRSVNPVTSPNLNDTPDNDALRASRSPTTVILTNCTSFRVDPTSDRPPPKVVPLKKQLVSVARSSTTGAVKEGVVRPGGVAAKSPSQSMEMMGARDVVVRGRGAGRVAVEVAGEAGDEEAREVFVVAVGTADAAVVGEAVGTAVAVLVGTTLGLVAGGAV